uniref:Thioredoxin-like fold domain-containing protein n=1 Tax=Chenopodium quinoa TaxID=63459 RepID=A0A803MWW9_CHEQI
MAVKERLVRRHIITDASCQFCGVSETVIHSLLDCVIAREIWNLSEYKDLLNDAPRSNFGELWTWLGQKVDASVVCAMAALMWAVWKRRNMMVYQGERPNGVMLAAGFSRLEQFYNEKTSNWTRNEAVDHIVDFVTKTIGEKYKSDLIYGLNDPNTDQKTRVSFKYASSWGVIGTPSFFVNGFALPDEGSAIDYKAWMKVIDPLVCSKK